MKDEQFWRPTKFELAGGRWRGSRNPADLSPGSRVTADLQAAAYSDALARFASGDLCDLGCGHVPAYGMYKDRVTSITCIDWADTPHMSPHLDLEADLREPLALPDAAFDTVLLTDVLEHMPYPDALFGELERILRPGGTLILGVPFLYGLHEQPHDHHRYTEFRLQLFCEDHCMDVVELYPYGRHDAVVLDLAAKFLSSSRFTRFAAGVPARLAALRPGNRSSTPLPLGYLLVARRQ